MRSLPPLLILIPLLVGCGDTLRHYAEEMPFAYHLDVQQGNVITQEAVDRLRPGMEPQQVRFVMGTPLLTDPFHPNRWDYFYSEQPSGKKRTQERVSLFFEANKLVRITGNYQPKPGPANALAPTEKLVVVPVRAPKQRSLLDRVLGFFGVEDLPEE